MRTLAIVGAGDLGQQIAHYALSDNHYDQVVFFDDFSTKSEISKCKILGNSDDIEQAFLNGDFDEIILGIGYRHLEMRKSLFERFNNLVPFGTIIHSSSWVDKTAIVKKGCVIYPCCTIDANVTIENNTVINVGCVISHDTSIGKHCFLSPRVAIAGFVDVEEMCILGINATIIDNIKLKARTQIGGGSVIISSIYKSGLYVGNPQRFVR